MESNIIIICDRCHRILKIIHAREDMSIQEYETMTINECHCIHCRNKRKDKEAIEKIEYKSRQEGKEDE